MKLKDLFIILRHRIKWAFLNRFRKLKNFLEYVIFIWKENIYYEYDYWFIYKFIMFKLKRMAKYWEQGLYVGSDGDYMEMLGTIRLMEEYKAYEDFEFLPDNYTEKDLISYNQKANKAWRKFHDKLARNSRKWWF